MGGPTNGQVQAVYEVMRLLREDDRDRGRTADETVVCASCRRDRPAAGSVRYGATTLCNGCATDYEVLKISGIVGDLAAYLAKET